MNRTEGLVVVDRLALLRTARRAGRLAEFRNDEAQEGVFRRYRGFDGGVWPVQAHPQFATTEGLANEADKAAVEAYLRALPNSADCDLLLLVRGNAADFVDAPRPGWSFAGFDVGFFESEWSHFSVVLNEVIFGNIPELVSFTAKLGPCLLFASLDDALALGAAYRRVANAGGDVEQGDVQPIAVWLPLFN
jgi:hypothetical protein